MKSPQRPFVVEIKSKRRSVGQSKAIWGNTDFKTLARLAEEDAPPLFSKAEIGEGAPLQTENHGLPSAATVVTDGAEGRDDRSSQDL
jgi:hypothetical protein